jgi:hypothetical protein
MDMNEKLSPKNVPGYSPTMYRIVGAVTHNLVNRSTVADVAEEQVQGPAYYASFSVTSDGFVIAQPGRRESGDFIGAYTDFERNLHQYGADAGLTAAERMELKSAMAARTYDWRT